MLNKRTIKNFHSRTTNQISHRFEYTYLFDQEKAKLTLNLTYLIKQRPSALFSVTLISVLTIIDLITHFTLSLTAKDMY